GVVYDLGRSYCPYCAATTGNSAGSDYVVGRQCIFDVNYATETDIAEVMTTDEQKQQRHKERQQRLKTQVDSAVAAAVDEKGLLLVITGNGKGKSTSGFGTVARAVGHGLRAAVVQFIKGGWDCGERNLLQQHG